MKIPLPIYPPPPKRNKFNLDAQIARHPFVAVISIVLMAAATGWLVWFGIQQLKP